MSTMTTDKTVSLPDDAVRLFIKPGNEHVQQGSAQIHWKIDPSVLEYLASHGAGDPQLLVVVTNGQDEMSRQLFPLSEGSRYVAFYRAGSNIVRATVVWRTAYDEGQNPLKRLLKKRNYGYAEDVLGHPDTPEITTLADELKRLYAQLDGDPLTGRERRAITRRTPRLIKRIETMRTNNEAVGFLDRLGWFVRRVPTETSLEVFVPPGVFSSGSWAITRILAGMFTSGRTPIDDCARRKRAGRNAVLAFISIVPAFLTELFNLLILALLLIAGMREISLDPLKHPFTYPPTDAFDDSEPSRWYYREVREGSLRDDGTTNFRTEYVPKPWTSFILKPPTLFGLGALYGLVWLVAHFQTLQWILLGVVGVVLLILLGVGIFTATQKLRAGRLAPKPGVLQAELAAILAGATVEPRASVWLRVETLKAKVCRPIAR